ncbi:hypothetical protein ElyMa_002131100 [Elysia marginata]|uniref:Uncharacterized protein n=1 Tax=Elysia marginata TaxID=1093978 RepID=A0AAV4FJW1_9GAST|nr:hypothetical protein ElyMa_002131100 [Elysia marginata]
MLIGLLVCHPETTTRPRTIPHGVCWTRNNYHSQDASGATLVREVLPEPLLTVSGSALRDFQRNVSSTVCLAWPGLTAPSHECRSVLRQDRWRASSDPQSCESRRKLRLSFQDVRAIRGAEVSSDHHMLQAEETSRPKKHHNWETHGRKNFFQRQSTTRNQGKFHS